MKQICPMSADSQQCEPHCMSDEPPRSRRNGGSGDRISYNASSKEELGGNSTDSSRHANVCFETSDCVNCSPDADFREEPPYGFPTRVSQTCCANRCSQSRRRLNTKVGMCTSANSPFKWVDNGCPNKGSCMHVALTSHPAYKQVGPTRTAKGVPLPIRQSLPLVKKYGGSHRQKKLIYAPRLK
jgi:hypothetical protein